MLFVIEKDVLLKGLGRVQSIVEKRNTIPILANVLMEADQAELMLTATDLEVGMRASYPATVRAPGKITVSAKKLYEIIRELPDAEVTVTAKENCWIEIRCGKAVFNIVGLAADEFPYFPLPEKEQLIPVATGLLREVVDRTAFAMSTDETKYNLNGIYFRSLEEGGRRMLRLVATDGHRLALMQKELDCTAIPELRTGVILPRKGIQELKKLAEDGEGEVFIGFKDNNAVLKKERTLVVMRLVDGEFPDYNRVIPKGNDNAARIFREPFAQALRRMSILSTERSRGVKVVLKPGILELSSSNPDLGDAREDLEIEYAGPEISIGFNARYLIDILQVQQDERVELRIRDNLSPGLIKPLQDDDSLAVVMPMRL